jgi:hypothetical protein
MKTRIEQLLDEIGRTLVHQTVDTIRAENPADSYPLAKWYPILEQLDAGDLMPLLPLLNVPEEVKPHFKQAFKRLKASRREQGRPPVPSYMPMAPNEANAIQAAEFVNRLKEGGADKEKATELMSLMLQIPITKLRAVLDGKASGARNLRARRARRAARK